MWLFNTEMGTLAAPRAGGFTVAFGRQGRSPTYDAALYRVAMKANQREQVKDVACAH